MTVWTIAAPASSLVLLPGMILRLEAISPTTGAAITGVTAAEWTVYGEELEQGEELDLVPALPLLTYGPEASSG